MFNDISQSWFDQTKLTSFQRQLNIYNFQRIGSGTSYMQSLICRPYKLTTFLAGLDMGSYHHEKFVRGHPELTREIRRQAIKGRGSNGRRSVPDIPKLYELPCVPMEAASTRTPTSLLAELSHDTIVPSSSRGTLGTDITGLQALRDWHVVHWQSREAHERQQQMQTLMLASVFDTVRNDAARALAVSPFMGLVLDHEIQIRLRAQALAWLRNLH
jgi:HSF-type DNA-binding